MIKARIVAMMVAPLLQGCIPDTGEMSRDTLPCAVLPETWVGGYLRTGWRDEGRGYITNTEGFASDTPSEDVGDGPSARVLYCPTGKGTSIRWGRHATLSAFEFLDLVRARGEFGTDLVTLARSYNLPARTTMADETSEVAACGCMAHYPNMDLPWTSRDD